MSLFIGEKKVGGTISKIVPEKRQGLDISDFIGEVDANGILRQVSNEKVHNIVIDEGVQDIDSEVFKQKFYNKTEHPELDLNGIPKVTGANAFNNFAYGSAAGLQKTFKGTYNLKEIGEYSFNYAFYKTNNNTGWGINHEIDFSALESVGVSGLSFTFYNQADIPSVRLDKLKETKNSSFAYCFSKAGLSGKLEIPSLEYMDDIKSGGITHNSVFSHAFDGTKLNELKFTNLKGIRANYTYTNSVSTTNGVFYGSLYSLNNLTTSYRGINCPNLEYIIGGGHFCQTMYRSSTSSTALKFYPFPKLEAIIGNGVFHQCYQYHSFNNGMKLFPALVHTKDISTYNGATRTTFGQAFMSAKINGPVFFESLGYQQFGSTGATLCYAQNSTLYGAAFTAASGITAFHFPATTLDNRGSAFITGFSQRFGAVSATYTPNASAKAIPMYFDITESIFVNGKRYYRDETQSIYDDNGNKTYIAWRRALITINDKKYIFWPRGLLSKDKANGYDLCYAWREDLPEIYYSTSFESTIMADYYTLTRTPTIEDFAAHQETINSNITAEFVVPIEAVEDEVVYTPFNASTYKEPTAPYYAWNGSDGKLYYSRFSEPSQFHTDAFYPDVHIKGDIGFYHSWMLVNETDVTVVTCKYNEESDTVQLQTNYTANHTLTRDPSKDLTEVTPVYSDEGVTKIGTVEYMNV